MKQYILFPSHKEIANPNAFRQYQMIKFCKYYTSVNTFHSNSIEVNVNFIHWKPHMSHSTKKKRNNSQFKTLLKSMVRNGSASQIRAPLEYSWLRRWSMNTIVLSGEEWMFSIISRKNWLYGLAVRIGCKTIRGHS